MATMKCSMCGKPTQRDGNRFWPFCSQACQDHDLGNWIDERYGLPWEDPSREENTFGPDDDEDDGDAEQARKPST